MWFFEELLDKNKFNKYTTNYSFQMKMKKGTCSPQVMKDHEFIDALTHWSLQHNSGKRMLADLQGQGLTLTDPLFADVDEE